MPGMPLRTMVQVNTKMMRAQGKISEHDELIALKTADIISGGKKGG
ncbi:MAG: hypothetical protein Ct9H90mP15_04580 [Candidatus Neomarinimicrobiota bacterium]|nr:MAG: hypothetical protein Ct9H90mP15_04580 [Candidatus Neomarinimicrobiota bacterium]